MCSSYSSEYMRMSSIYRSIYMSIYSLNSESTRSQSVTGALVSPNGMMRYSYRLSYNLNAVFYSSPSLIYIIWKATLRSSLVNHFLPQSLSRSLSILNNRYRFFLVISFSCLQLIQGRRPLSFFTIKKIRYPTSDFDFLIFPILTFLLIQSFRMILSFWFIRYILKYPS